MTVAGRADSMPFRLVVSATDTALERGAAPLTEAHLLHAVLHAPNVQALLNDMAVQTGAIAEFVASKLELDAPPTIERLERSDGGFEIRRYGVVDQIEGRAVVLAATPEAHAVDEVDVLVAGLFDPTSMTSRAFAVVAGVDRDAALQGIVDRMARYRNVLFPPTRLVQLGSSLRFPWTRQNEVIAQLKARVPPEVYWTYFRDEDELVVAVEEGHDLEGVLGERRPDT